MRTEPEIHAVRLSADQRRIADVARACAGLWIWILRGRSPEEQRQHNDMKPGEHADTIRNGNREKTGKKIDNAALPLRQARDYLSRIQERTVAIDM